MGIEKRAKDAQVMLRVSAAKKRELRLIALERGATYAALIDAAVFDPVEYLLPEGLLTEVKIFGKRYGLTRKEIVCRILLDYFARDYAAAEVTGIGLPGLAFTHHDPPLTPPNLERWLAATYLAWAKTERRESIIASAKAGITPSREDRAFLSENGWDFVLPVNDVESAMRKIENDSENADAGQSTSGVK